MRTSDKLQTVDFIRMQDGTAREYAFLDSMEDQYKAELSDRLLAALENLEHSMSGYKVSRLEHCLQSATRAHRAGESEEWVIALRPFVSDEIYWVIKHHGIFQMYYYAHHSGGDRHARDQFKDHPFYDAAVKFCHEYDQVSFDPDYQSEPLSFFAPILKRVCAQPKAFDAEHQARYGASEST